LKIEYHTNEYVHSHGKEPRGRGSWAMQVTAIDHLDGEGEIHFSRGNMTLTEAKKSLKARILTEVWDINCNADVVDIEILP